MNSDAYSWKPSAERAAATQMEDFRRHLNRTLSLDLPDYAALHAWSVREAETFWCEVWDYAGIVAQTRGSRVLDNPEAMPGARWFPGARLNFAENLLRDSAPGDTGVDTLAIRFQGEQGDPRDLSRGQLYGQVRAVARALRSAGVQAGDRVAGFLPNIPEAVVAMLASSSIGAVWSSCSPDFGINGVRDRFGQIEPRVLFTADGYRYAGRQHDSLAVVSELAGSLPDLRAIVIVPFIDSGSRLTGEAAGLAVPYGRWLEEDASIVAEAASAAAADALESAAHSSEELIDFAPLPFDHPLYIMFSSGTTGKPKCIVHGAGGTLLQHVKEHLLHTDVRAGDRLFFFTTCGWMMWNWLVSALATRATVLLFDGSPFHPDGNTLFDYAQSAGMTHFGTSAKFIDACNKAGLSPRHTHDLTELRSMLSTGSPLVPESFDYVYEHVSTDICLSSMSGGTDILSCFALGNPAMAVYRGELQCRGLGMDVQVYGDDGKPVAVGEKGELVCVRPFPSMPIGFFGDDDGSRYHAAYFDRFENIWCHGDYVAETTTGGLVIYGRSDAVLNPGGVRIGTAEIYRQVESFDEIVESLVIGQQWQGDVRVVLFVCLREGLQLDDALRERIKLHIRQQTTPRHVPARIVQVTDIPRTRSGKIVELAVRKVVHGQQVDNIEALANPQALALFENLPELTE
ncbi:MAG: acetoacetate--CoA ligase [Granulosicoccus sp.]|nr:acetoacetate--CoA ligase [Granulosicoccus sp.]